MPPRTPNPKPDLAPGLSSWGLLHKVSVAHEVGMPIFVQFSAPCEGFGSPRFSLLGPMYGCEGVGSRNRTVGMNSKTKGDKNSSSKTTAPILVVITPFSPEY